MSNTTTTRPDMTTTYSLDYIYSLFVNPVVAVRFYQIGYPITFILGFIGNIASLITFSHSTLRRVSTGCLFIVLAISDTLFLVVCVVDFVEFGLQISFYRHLQYDDFCRFRSFIMYTSQVLSSWTLVTISFDRWIRTRFPYKSNSLCTPKKALLMVGVLVLLDIGLHVQILTPMYGMLIPGFAMVACGPTIYNVNYFIFYFLTWSVIQIFVICLVPAALMLAFLVDIYHNIRSRKRAVAQPGQSTHDANVSHHQKNLQRQMLILMLTSIAIFLTTTLPLAIYKITTPRQNNISSTLVAIASIWIGLGWFQSLNYAVNFYSHCLTSTLFRKEFKHQVAYLLGHHAGRVSALEISATAMPRTQLH